MFHPKPMITASKDDKYMLFFLRLLLKMEYTIHDKQTITRAIQDALVSVNIIQINKNKLETIDKPHNMLFFL
ncbi:TPA: hypothetical protein AB5A62_003461, partial [Vibrio cholerae]